MISKIFLTLYKIVRILVAAALSICGGAFILFVAYVIDPNFSSNFNGNDVMSAYNYAVWLDKIFPHLYFWYPLQGAGVSFISGYQWLAHILVIIVERTANIPLSAAFATVRSISFPITGIGIILFCTTRLEYPKQIPIRVLIGTIAAGFFLLSPITWYWTHKWGFYAEGVSYMFIPFALLFADWFIELSFKEDKSYKTKIALIVASLFWSLGLMTHFYTGTGIAHFILILFLGRYLIAISPQLRKQSIEHPGDTFAERAKKYTLIGLKSGLLLVGTFLIMSGWRLFSYIDYTKEVAKGGFAGDIFSVQNAQALNKPSLGQLTQLEFIAFPDQRFIFDGYSVPLTIWIGALITLMFGWIRSKKIFVMSLAVLYGFFSYSSTTVIAFTYILGPLAQVFNFRSVWTVYRVIVPIVAAYGFFVIPDLLYAPIQFAFRKINAIVGIVSAFTVQPAIITIGGLLLLFYTANSIELHNYFLGIKLPTYRSTITYFEKPNFWVLTAGRRDIDSRDLWSWQDSHYDLIKDNDEISSRIRIQEIKQICTTSSPQTPAMLLACETLNKGGDLSTEQKSLILSECEHVSRSEFSKYKHCISTGKSLAWQLNPQNWPQPQFPESVISTEEEKREFEHLPQNALQTRYDLSGLSGSVVMKAPLLSPLSTTQVYINQLSLFSALWNYQSSVMYAEQPRYQKPGVLSELADYFGYEYVNAATSSHYAADLYENDTNWTKLNKGTWWRYNKPTGLATWTAKPRVLMISNNEKFGYDQFIKVANLGVLSYNTALIYGGTTNVDDYSLQELQKFNALILAGYKYRDKQKGHELLNQYVASGGNLFIDTGWQYQSPDWELSANVPSFLPTNKLSWKTFDSFAETQIDNQDVIKFESEANTLGKLSPTGKEWGASTAEDVRDNSSVLLQVKGSPLMIARKYEKGKVVWSGMNSISHVEATLETDNTTEIAFLNKVLEWLVKPECNEECQPPKDYAMKVTRLNPDHIRFTSQEQTKATTALYWRESYYPKWKATLKNKNGSNSDVEVYRAGPRLMGMVVPPLSQGETIDLEIKPVPKEIAVYALTICGAILVLCYLLNIRIPKPSFKKKSIGNNKLELPHHEEENNSISS